MANADSDAFVRFVLDRGGDAVRSVVHYDADGSDVRYLRDDVADGYSALGLETLMAALRREGERAGRQEHVYAHGELNCIVRCFDGGLEMHFPYGDSEGVAVVLEPRAAEHLYGFVDECLVVLDVPIAEQLGQYEPPAEATRPAARWQRSLLPRSARDGVPGRRVPFPVEPTANLLS